MLRRVIDRNSIVDALPIKTLPHIYRNAPLLAYDPPIFASS